MAERSTIQSSGFANVGPIGARTGVVVRLRQPNYRGTRLSLIEGIDITIDGETYAAEDNRIHLQGAVLTHADMADATQQRWNVGECLLVEIEKAGGLTLGVHEVCCTIRFRHPYFPPEFRPAMARDQRHVTIITA